LKSFVFTKTRLDLPLMAYDIVAKPEEGERPLPLVWLIGGVHGNEPEGVVCVWRCLSKALEFFPFKNFKLRIIPQFNPEGLLSGSRLNSNQVDLNRNLPTKDWTKEAFSPKYPPGDFANSEPENQALVKSLDENSSEFIFSIHSFDKYLMNINGDCEWLAKKMQELNEYPIEKSMGYPTPGCLGTYAGLERGIPTITYEIQRGLDLESIVKIHSSAIWRGLEEIEKFLEKGTARR